MAKQLGTLVTQIASLKKGMATESTQQQVLHLLTQMQNELTQVLVSQPKKLTFATDRIPHFDEAFSKAIQGTDIAGLNVEVAYEFKVQVVGRNLAYALRLASIPTRESLNGTIDPMGAEAGIFATYVGDKYKAEQMIAAIDAGLRKAGVVDGPIPTLASSPTSGGKTDVTILIKH